MALVAEFSIVSLTTFIFFLLCSSFLFLVLLMLRSFICWTDLVSYHSPLWTNAIFCKDIYSILHLTVCSIKVVHIHTTTGLMITMENIVYEQMWKQIIKCNIEDAFTSRIWENIKGRILLEKEKTYILIYIIFILDPTILFTLNVLYFEIYILFGNYTYNKICYIYLRIKYKTQNI